MHCPRKMLSPVFKLAEREDKFHEIDHCCTFCGSLDPDIFMARLEKGDVILTPTDKNYKVYIQNHGGEDFVQRYRTDDKPFIDHDSPEHTWVTRPMNEQKFYFPHLSVEQQNRFIELYNQKKISLNVPGYFYVTPYFCKKVEK